MPPRPPRAGSSDGPGDAARDRASSRAATVVVALTVLLGLVALYTALGGPLPFVVDGGPSLDSVPSEADAVVYADAWTFSSESSRSVVDGLLAASNRSLPGYTGPATLQDAAEKLRRTTLSPEALRSVTAFGGYGPEGGPSDYRAVILRTAWNTDPLLSTFGGDADAYERREYNGTTVFVHEDRRSEFAWVGVLGADQYVLGSQRAVTDAIDAYEGRDDGMTDRLRSRFDALDRGRLRFVATIPASLPGDSLAPRSLVDTVAGIETVAGVYHPEHDGAAVELSLTADDEATARSLVPAVDEAIAFASQHVPDRTARLLDDAAVDRSARTLTVSLSGPNEAFVGGYTAVLETPLVRLLLGQPVGQPALGYVPADATVVAYGDAAVVADPTSLALVEAFVGDRPSSDAVTGAVQRVRAASALDPTALRSVTAFARDETGSDAAAVVEAGWSAAAVGDTLDTSGVSHGRRTVGGVPVFEVTVAGQQTWIAVFADGHLAVGNAATVADVVGVANGSQAALGAPLRPAFERLPHSYATVVTRAPGAVDALDDTLGGVVSELELVGASYDTAGGRVSLRVDMEFATAGAARNAGTTLEVARRLAGGQVDNASVAALLSETTLSREAAVVTALVRAEPTDVVGAVGWLATLDLPIPSVDVPLFDRRAGRIAATPQPPTATALSPAPTGGV